MECSDSLLVNNLDWDPLYLASIFDVDFDECSDLWESDISDQELLDIVGDMETYCPNSRRHFYG